jgi:hypothetical protein
VTIQRLCTRFVNIYLYISVFFSTFNILREKIGSNNNFVCKYSRTYIERIWQLCVLHDLLTYTYIFLLKPIFYDIWFICNCILVTRYMMFIYLSSEQLSAEKISVYCFLILPILQPDMFALPQKWDKWPPRHVHPKILQPGISGW